MVEPLRSLTLDQRAQLLQHARHVAHGHFSATTPSPRERPLITGAFGGAFVTFWASSELRGCVGSFVPTEDLVRTVEQVTRSSLADPRFQTKPVTAEELVTLSIEISVLSGLTSCTHPSLLTPGLHGVLVRKGDASGCFLPKVASEHGWSAEELLSKCCALKAGLPEDAWRDQITDVMLFTAESFSE